jgi:hypothetical protein
MRPETKASRDNIMDVFAGADGGVDFINFNCFLEEFDKRAANGDKDAEEILQVVHRFNRLLNVAKKPC